MRPALITHQNSMLCARRPSASLDSLATQQQTKPFNTRLVNSARCHAAYWPAHRNVSTPHSAAGTEAADTIHKVYSKI